MPSPETLDRFIATVEAGHTVEAIEAFYAEQAAMQENLDSPRVGRAALMAHEQRAQSGVQELEIRCIRPVLSAGDTVVVRWQIGYRTTEGRSVRFEELAHQRWEGERIVHEQFFYDPAQFARSVATAA